MGGYILNRGNYLKMYQGVFVKQESKKLHLTVFGKELDFLNLPTGIPAVIAQPLLSTLEYSGYQQMVIQSFAKSAHPLLCSIGASGVCPCTLSALFIVLASALGSKAGIMWRVPTCECPHPSFTS